MTDQDRGIMKFKGADNAGVVVLSGFLLLGSIILLILWALQFAYAVQ